MMILDDAPMVCVLAAVGAYTLRPVWHDLLPIPDLMFLGSLAALVIAAIALILTGALL